MILVDKFRTMMKSLFATCTSPSVGKWTLVILTPLAASLALAGILTLLTPITFGWSFIICSAVCYGIIGLALRRTYKRQKSVKKSSAAPENFSTGSETGKDTPTATPVTTPKLDDTQEISIPSTSSTMVAPEVPDVLPPPPYDSSLHGLEFIVPLARNLGLGIVLIATYIFATLQFSIDALYSLVLVLALAVLVFLTIREHWVWKNRPYRCDPKDGRLRAVQTRNMWLLLRGSSDDIYPLGEGDTTIDSPKQSWTESLFFRRSQTLILRNTSDISQVKLIQRHFKDLNELIAIDAYRRELETIGVLEQKRANALQAQAIKLQEETNRLLRRRTLDS